jgi:hypothetical protein
VHPGFCPEAGDLNTPLGRWPTDFFHSNYLLFSRGEGGKRSVTSYSVATYHRLPACNCTAVAMIFFFVARRSSQWKVIAQRRSFRLLATKSPMQLDCEGFEQLPRSPHRWWPCRATAALSQAPSRGAPRPDRANKMLCDENLNLRTPYAAPAQALAIAQGISAGWALAQRVSLEAAEVDHARTAAPR